MNPNGFGCGSWVFVSRVPLALFFPTRASRRTVCFFSKGRSGVSGKAYIEGCFIVSRGKVGMLLWAERHPHGMPLGQWFGVIHCEALLVAPAEASKRYLRS